ncbi:hypothetical protein [Bacteroides sp.]
MFRTTIGLCFALQTHPHPQALISSFCTPDQMFAVGFLQIPPHGGTLTRGCMLPVVRAH